MNKLIMENGKIISCPSGIKIQEIGSTLQIECCCDFSAELSFKKDFNMPILFLVQSGVKGEVFEYYEMGEKISYTYQLASFSELSLEVFSNSSKQNVQRIVYLKEEGASFNCKLATIAFKEEIYQYFIYHEAPFTKSFIRNHGVTKEEGKIDFQVSNFVKKGCFHSVVDQKNRIVNFSENLCTIKPNLFIDEYDCSANHSAYIGTFKKEEMFYLQSRGIEENLAMQLLLKGFLKEGMNTYFTQICKIIDTYWR